MGAVEELVDFWRRASLSEAPYVHPEDASHVAGADFEFRLLPLPVIGDIAHADIVVCMLNPGLKPTDYEWELRPDFRATLERNLRQEAASTGHPFFYLDPSYDTHPGARYWIGGPSRSPGERTQQKLRKTVQSFAASAGISLPEAQKITANRIAILQLVPYHSARFNDHQVLDRLPSSRLARRVAHEVGDGRLRVIPRATRFWGFQEPIANDQLVVYPTSLGAAAPLTPQSAGGAAILKRLLASS